MRNQSIYQGRKIIKKENLKKSYKTRKKPYFKNKRLKKFPLKALGLICLVIIFVLISRPQIGRIYPTDEYEIISDIEELEPKTRELCYEFVDRCQEAGLDVVVIETYRSQERQDRLYDQGRVTDGPVVTWTRDSIHTKRRAFDIVKAGDDPYSDEDFFRRCAEIGEDLGLECGYYWDKADMGHYQRNTLKENILK